jgi:hypothetical protein
LQGKQIIQIVANSGIAQVQSKIVLPPLPTELKPILSIILNAADNLYKMQRHALERAEAAKLTSTENDIANDLKALSAA